MTKEVRAGVVAILVAFLLIASVSYFWPVSEPYFPFNESWNGCSEIYKMVSHADPLYSFSEPLTPKETSLIVIVGPTVPFEESESAKLRSYLESGGDILLADDYGSGNGLLQYLGVSARFSGKPLADIYFYSKTPTFPLVSDFAEDPVTRNLTAVIMDHPSYIETQNTSSIKIVALSSAFSFIDSLNNGAPSAGEKTQAYPMIVIDHVGNGLLILVANAHLFANEMINLFDNRILFRNLLRVVNGAVAFDVAHLAKAPLTVQRIAFKNMLNDSVAALGSVLAQLVVTATLVIAFSLAYLRKLRIGRRQRKVNLAEPTLHTEIT